MTKPGFISQPVLVMLLGCYMSLNLPGLHHANIASHITGWLSSVAAYNRRFCHSVNLIKPTCKDDAITSRCPPLNCCRAQWYRWLACNASVSNTSILNFKFAKSQTQDHKTWIITARHPVAVLTAKLLKYLETVIKSSCNTLPNSPASPASSMFTMLLHFPFCWRNYHPGKCISPPCGRT